MTKDQKINYLVAPITLLIVLIVAIILGICQLSWKYYVIGAMVSLLCHGLMVKQNARLERFAKIDPENKVYNPKKSALLWYLLRFVVAAVVFAALIFMANVKDNPHAIIDILIALAGYLTLKIVFIVLLLTSREKVKDEWFIRLVMYLKVQLYLLS